MKLLHNIAISWRIMVAILKLLWAARHEEPNRAKVRRIIKAINCHEQTLKKGRHYNETKIGKINAV